jgi:hypothetical protein
VKVFPSNIFGAKNFFFFLDLFQKEAKKQIAAKIVEKIRFLKDSSLVQLSFP